MKTVNNAALTGNWQVASPVVNVTKYVHIL